MFESKDISHVVENFRIAAREKEGRFNGTPLVTVILQVDGGAIYVACKNNDEKLLKVIDEYVDLISSPSLMTGISLRNR